MAFRFLHFSVEDTNSTLRVGTDAMLLGSWAEPGNALQILDIGTGCGVLALMMAQKSKALIEAIDIDLPSVMEARKNFNASPWDSRLNAFHNSLQLHSGRDGSYDFIITNPPFFSHSLRSPSPRTNLTRHGDSLSLKELIAYVSRILKPDGSFAIVLPYDQMARFEMLCPASGLQPKRRMKVYPKPGLPPKRVLAEFIKGNPGAPSDRSLTILNTDGKYSSEYLTLTGCFHNF